MPITYSVKSAAQQAGLSERTLFSAIKDGRLQVWRVGRRVLIPAEALQAFLQGRNVKGGE